MKKIMIRLIKIYKLIPFNCHNYCKYNPSCSNYAIECYEKYGFIKGTFLSIKRIIRCNPFSKGGYDPVPERNKI